MAPEPSHEPLVSIEGGELHHDRAPEVASPVHARRLIHAERAGERVRPVRVIYAFEPSYLGLVEILAVRADQSVAKPVTRMNGVIQVGDRVSSRVAPKR